MKIEGMEKRAAFHAVKTEKITGASICKGGKALGGAVRGQASFSFKEQMAAEPAGHKPGLLQEEYGQDFWEEEKKKKSDGKLLRGAVLVSDKRKHRTVSENSGIENVRQTNSSNTVKDSRQTNFFVDVREDSRQTDNGGMGRKEVSQAVSRKAVMRENDGTELPDSMSQGEETAYCYAFEEIGNEEQQFFREEDKKQVSRLSVEDLERRCGIKNTRGSWKDSGAAEQQFYQAQGDGHAAEKTVEPLVCSVEEREERKKAKEGHSRDNKRNTAGKIKRAMVRDYMVKELTHENRKDASYEKQLLERLVKLDAARVFKHLGKVFLALMGKILLFLMPVILLCVVILVPVVLVYGMFMSPEAYFSSVFNFDNAAEGNPLYLKNVVQEMYTDFYGQIALFQDSNGNNEVTYAYGTYNNVEEIVAVYLALVTSIDNYKNMEETDTGYPPYLFIDTDEERTLLGQVFAQFNYTEMEAVKVTLTGEDGKEREEDAYKMTVYFLTIDKWKEQYASGLSEEEEKLLEELLAAAESSEDNLASFSGEAVPIEDLVIPEGVDENLVYLAGFIRAEAGNQSDTGKIAVAYVILNRAGAAGGDIKGVLTAPYQFSCYIPFHTVEQYLNGYAQMTNEERENDSCWQAALHAYYGTADNPIGDRKYYCNPKYCSVGEEIQWQKIYAHNTEEDIVIIGDHVFCRYCW